MWFASTFKALHRVADPRQGVRLVLDEAERWLAEQAVTIFTH
jgi:hypothetical protein